MIGSAPDDSFFLRGPPTDMLIIVRDTIRRHKMFRSGDTVVVAVSGGADSVALLHVLHSLHEYRLSLIVAHFNHMLRGTESDDDEQFVRTIAADHGLPFVVGRYAVDEFAEREGLSLEEAGRLCRYRYFDEIAAKHRAAVVVLAHHADDQAETVLMRLLRGSGATGLRGMSPKSNDGKYVRPLLSVSRHQIERYLAERGLTFRTDSSNCDLSFLRNRIRHELLPTLETYNPAVRELLTATADALAADEMVLEEFCHAAFDSMADVQPDRVGLPVQRLRNEPQALRMRLYRRALALVRGDLRRIGRRHLNAIDSLVHDRKPHLSLDLPDGTSIGRRYDNLFISAAGDLSKVLIGECVIGGPGTFSWNGYVVTVMAVDAAELSVPGPWKCCFDGEAAPFPWTVRSFRNGDRFVPFGMTGHKKVKDYFIDQKISREKRLKTPLLFSGADLLWVIGLRRSALAPVTAATRSVITVDVVLPEP